MTQPFTSSAASRFLRYVTFDTQSDEQSETYPSTAKQLVLLNQLVHELKDMGVVGRGYRSIRLCHGDDSRDAGQGAGARHRVHRSCRYVARRERRRRATDRPPELRRARSRAARRSVDGAARGRQPRARGPARQRHHHRLGAHACSARTTRQASRKSWPPRNI